MDKSETIQDLFFNFKKLKNGNEINYKFYSNIDEEDISCRDMTELSEYEREFVSVPRECRNFINDNIIIDITKNISFTGEYLLSIDNIKSNDRTNDNNNDIQQLKVNNYKYILLNLFGNRNDYKNIQNDILKINIKNLYDAKPNYKKQTIKTYIILVVKKLFEKDKIGKLFIEYLHLIKFNNNMIMNNKIIENFVKELYLLIVKNICNDIINKNLYTYYNNKKTIKLLSNVLNFKVITKSNLNDKDFINNFLHYILNFDEFIINNITTFIKSNWLDTLTNIINNKTIDKYLNFINIQYNNSLNNHFTTFNKKITCDVCFETTNRYFNRYCCYSNHICLDCSIKQLKNKNSCPFCNDNNFLNYYNTFSKCINNRIKNND